MTSRTRTLVAPVYLLACLILGGSAQGIWQNMILQLAGVAIIAWAAMEKGQEQVPRPAAHLLLIAILAISLVGLQLLPLPPAVWSHLGGRQKIAEGFVVLGVPIPDRPLSLTPASGISSLLATIPALAMVCAMVRLKAYRPQLLAVALIVGTLAGIALGAMQVASSGGEISPLYLYEETNPGRAVGFFANADHMATLLIVTIPFLAAIVAAGTSASMQRYSAIVAVAIGLGIVVVVGLALNGSLAGYGLALPVIAASALVILPPRSKLRGWIVLVTALLVLASVIALETTSIGAGKIGQHATNSVQSRADILATTAEAAADFMPFGSGLGSFRSVYPLYERPERVTTEYVVHAHNDYAEIALEFGVAGIILIALFLGWWSSAVWRAWRKPEGPFARAAAVASAAVLVHSIVDFPLRTAAISVCFAMSLALLADARAAPPKEKAQLRRSRHVEFR
jgi:O-antigen ligase